MCRRLLYLLYLSLLTPVVSPTPLLYQSLPTSIHDGHAIGRRRNDDTPVGTAARGIVAGLYRVPRRVHRHGGAVGRLRGALSTSAGDRGPPAQRPPLPPGALVPLAQEACRGHRDIRRGRATGSPRLPRYRPLGSSPVAQGP